MGIRRMQDEILFGLEPGKRSFNLINNQASLQDCALLP